MKNPASAGGARGKGTPYPREGPGRLYIRESWEYVAVRYEIEYGQKFV